MDAGSFIVSTPKRTPSNASRASESYPYYAGYSEKFAKEALAALALENATVLDSWNGAGTTTFAASLLGLNSVGIDLNPVMVVVAKSRLCIGRDITRARNILSDIISKNDFDNNSFPLKNDPLSEWIGIVGGRIVRNVVDHLMNFKENYLGNLELIGKKVSEIKSWKCFLILVLFKAVKNNSAVKNSSNPTWTKRSENEINFLSENEWKKILLDEFSKLESIHASQEKASFFGKFSEREILCASAESIPVAGSSVDLVLTSPPYCTRIDYAVSTLIELAVLGLSSENVDELLRRKLLGTTAIRKEEVTINANWGEACTEFLLNVRGHPSSGSKSYYYKNFAQYFDSLFISITELKRVLRPDGIICAVVQGSHYKEHLIDLPKIFSQMANSVGFTLEKVASFQVDRHFANVNVKSKKYRDSNSMVEQVLVFRKLIV